MANTISALKRIRQTERRTTVNRMRKTRFRNQLKAVRRLLDNKEAAAARTALPATFSAIDRAARFGVIKKNTAARYKSRLQARLQALRPSAA
ncbi:MAG: 30S ribosomal protein S20 [Acidobacteria bacterium]|nr:30S ribosomal protein S20 [Acidobacteriota bacterium]